ncbi:GNAT family N-acetyltransferase [Oceanobacillus bengalensis]|uniref:GNAT family N-acetyltransferase n=1 Tax=Oceanobacillus bengalensis TaxID=1435466 RepID=A0A494Z3L9_9BACI|nr:GNAT family N-acetyltransferase [Oceanobacillus bengalensis]
MYVEAEPTYGEGNIEFFAVKESERGKGLGGQLLAVGLNWLFIFDTIDIITLCVNSSNEKAIRLYEQVGFKRKHELSFFTKEIEIDV